MVIEPKLRKFYVECLLPKIIDSRLDRGHAFNYNAIPIIVMYNMYNI